jgi:hypothetical protein
MGDRRGEGNHLANLRIAYRDLGQVEKAIERTESASSIFVETRSPYADQTREQLADLRRQASRK